MTTLQLSIPSESRQARTPAVTAFGGALAMGAFVTPITTLAGTAAALGAGTAGQAWILNAMPLGLAVGLLPAGALGDDLGRRRVFRGGAAGLVIASVCAGLAPVTGALVAARIGQGLACAAIMSCGLGLIAGVVPAGPPRSRASGIWGAAMSAGAALGPILAGVLELAAGWRAAYWLAAALAAVLAVGGRSLPDSRAPRRRPADHAGMLTLAGASAALLAALVQGRGGWVTAGTLGLLAAAAVLGTLFVLVELRRADPMLDPRLLRRGGFAGATAGAFATGAGVFAALSFVPTLVQRGLGYSALAGGLAVSVWAAAGVAASLGARRLPGVDRPRAHLVAGLLVVATGILMLGGLEPHCGPARLLPGLLVAGLGTGLLNAALARQAVATAPAGRPGLGSGANNAARNLGSAIGVTVVVVLAAHPEPAALLGGWDLAVAVTAAVSALGAILVATRSAAPPAAGPAAG